MKFSGMAKRGLAAAALGAAVLTLPFAPSTGHATTDANRPPLRCPLETACGTVYYSDAAHTTAVGAQLTDCEAVLSSWGIQTGYTQYVQTPCD